MAGADNLVSPNGKPLISKQPNLIVIHSEEPLRGSMMDGIVQLTKSAVICLPMTATFMSGKVAKKDMDSIRSAIHAIEELPDINFTKEELTVLHKAMEFLCSHTDPEPSSIETSLKNSIAQALK